MFSLVCWTFLLCAQFRNGFCLPETSAEPLQSIQPNAAFPGSRALPEEGQATELVEETGGSFLQSLSDYATEETLEPQEEEPNFLAAALEEDIHYHPGLATDNVNLNSELSATFLSAPPWAEEDIYNEEDYAAYYSVRNSENTRLNEEEIAQVVAHVRAKGGEGTRTSGRDDNEDVQTAAEPKLLLTEGIGILETKDELSPGDIEFEYTVAEEQALEAAMKRKRAPPGVRVMCYSMDAATIVERCSKSKNWGDTVLIQINDSHNFLEFGPEWYDAIRKLKEETGLGVVGVFFGAPEWWRLSALLSQHRQLLEGVQINVEGKEGACITDLADSSSDSFSSCPVRGSGDATATNLALADLLCQYPDLQLSYLVKGEDPQVCKTTRGYESRWDVHANHPDREMQGPAGVALEFPCYDGYEGRCFQAFTNYRETACNPTKQRYVFAPYDKASNRMLHLFNESCLGTSSILPPHDVVQAI